MSDNIDHKIHLMVAKAKILSSEEEAVLLELWLDKKDMKARDALLHSHMKLVASMAAKFAKSGDHFADLFNEGYEAMISAADKFNREKKCRFSTYASWWIFSKLQDAVHRNIYSVKIGRSHDEKRILRHLHVAKELFGPALNQSIIQAIAEFADVEPEFVSRVNGAVASRSQSLNSTIGTSETSGTSEVGDTVEDLSATQYGAEFSILTQNQRKLLEKYFRRLTDKRAPQILRDRWLSDNGEVKSLTDISEMHQVSKERIRQIEREALQQIRQMMNDDKLSISDLLAS